MENENKSELVYRLMTMKHCLDEEIIIKLQTISSFLAIEINYVQEEIKKREDYENLLREIIDYLYKIAKDDLPYTSQYQTLAEEEIRKLRNGGVII